MLKTSVFLDLLLILNYALSSHLVSEQEHSRRKYMHTVWLHYASASAVTSLSTLTFKFFPNGNSSRFDRFKSEFPHSAFVGIKHLLKFILHKVSYPHQPLVVKLKYVRSWELRQICLSWKTRLDRWRQKQWLWNPFNVLESTKSLMQMHSVNNKCFIQNVSSILLNFISG